MKRRRDDPSPQKVVWKVSFHREPWCGDQRLHRAGDRPGEVLIAPSPMSQNGSEPQNSGVAAKAFVSMTPCLLCLYVNGVMLFSLGRRRRRPAAFLESSRYLLFGHLLLSDSLHLLACVALYLVAVARARLARLPCVFLLLLGDAVAMASPFTLALMSLERYVAVCHPLRHAGVSTPRRTGATLTVVWCVAAVDPVGELLYFLALDERRPNAGRQRHCQRKAALGWALFARINTAFTVVYFLLVGGVILYTYVRILLAARSAAAAVAAAGTAAGTSAAAGRTVLLHMLQLCLCLASTTFNAMSSLVMLSFGVVAARNVQYLLFLSLVIFPRVLSPLIYGLRDKAFRRVFTHYFLFGLRRTHRKPLAGGSSGEGGGGVRGRPPSPRASVPRGSREETVREPTSADDMSPSRLWKTPQRQGRLAVLHLLLYCISVLNGNQQASIQDGGCMGSDRDYPTLGMYVLLLPSTGSETGDWKAVASKVSPRTPPAPKDHSLLKLGYVTPGLLPLEYSPLLVVRKLL
ncbi:unnamed protein product [Boreogadus saida]